MATRTEPRRAAALLLAAWAALAPAGCDPNPTAPTAPSASAASADTSKAAPKGPGPSQKPQPFP